MTMLEKIHTLWPEILLLATAVVVLMVGLSAKRAMRRAAVGISAAGLIAAAVTALVLRDAQGALLAGAFATYVKVAVCLVGLLLLVMAAEAPDEAEAEPEPGKPFNPGDVSRGEFFAFVLLSLIGAMLCAGADSLVWLFLALELTSLPTYIMVATSRRRIEAPEAGVKYFFLGAFAAAIFLYGFALIYGGTGYTTFDEIQLTLARSGMHPLVLTGLLLAIVGVAFKIAAVPMHFYAADVYQGAASPVTALLAFVPKTAGFVALILLLGLVGWPLDYEPLVWLLWAMAAATMFVGNTMALRQTNVKRVLAYSSVAHSGYMLVGLVAGPAAAGEGARFVRNGLAAVLFYLVVYGVMNLGAFAVLGVLKSKGEDAETYDDLRGLARRHPGLAAGLAVCVLALTGIPPLAGFWGKVFLFGAAISAEFFVLAVLALVNSAIGAVYYLRIVGTCFVEAPNEQTRAASLPWRTVSAGAAAMVIVILSFAAGPLLNAAQDASQVPTRSEQAGLVQVDGQVEDTAGQADGR